MLANEINELEEHAPPVDGGNIATPSFLSLASTLSTASSEWGLADHSVMQLCVLCDLIAAHRSLQRTQILAAECYVRHGSSSAKKFLVLELRGLEGRVSYARLERRRKWLPIRRSRLALNGGEWIMNDLVRLLECEMTEELTSYLLPFTGSRLPTQGRSYPRWY